MALPLAIIVALPTEASLLSRHILTQHTPLKLGEHVELMLSGMGSDNARQAATQVITQGAAALLSFGTAAGISPKCQAGDVLLADSCIDSSQQRSQVNTPWQQALTYALAKNNAINLIHGMVYQSDQIVNSFTAKQKIFDQTHAIAIDMESATLAQVANNHNIPFVSLRVIVDTADMQIPEFILNAMDQHGNVNNKKIFYGLLQNPRKLLALVHLARNFYLARKALGHCVSTTGLEFKCDAAD